MYIYSHQYCLQHQVPNGHAERAERIASLLSHLEACGLTQDYPTRTAPLASNDDLLLAHPQSHLEFIDSMRPTEEGAMVPVDPDTWMGTNSLLAATAAAGAVCAGVTDLINGETDRVFCAVRPPGHHAEIDTAMGFCLFNSVAIGALKALRHEGIDRVAIVDFDVHHGNGTVDIFKDNPNVLVCSSFQHPYYPNRMTDVQRNNIVNTPLAAGTDGNTFRQRIEADWIPALEQHKPDMIFISAGFDGHKLDPLANLNLVEDDYAWVTQLITAISNDFSQRRILSTLEGGYDLSALCSSVETHLKHLA